MKQVLRILQITDIHLYADPLRTLKGINTEASFQAVLACALESIQDPDLLLLTGDLAHDEAEATYQRLKQTLDGQDTPYHAIPGNHDDPDILFKVLGKTHLIDSPHWRIIMLDSHVNGAVGGALSEAEWLRLERELKAAGDKYILVCIHHPPLPIGSSWMDKIGLKQGDRFMDLLSTYSGVRLVINGHIHQDSLTQKHGIPVLGSPSTNVQFQADDDQPGYATLEPGFRSLTLHQDGSFDTGVLRVPGFAQQLDQDENY